MDDIFMFNPASSPFQDQGMLQEYGNDPGTIYFINQGDLVSNGLYQQIEPDTFNSQVTIGDYIYSPLGAHSLDQWFPDDVNQNDDVYKPPVYEGLEDLNPDATMFQDTPETQEANLS